jgi:homoserine dehydrogenase
VDVATGRYQNTAARFHFFTSATAVPLLPEEDEVTGSYARFSVTDKPGVLAGLTAELNKRGVSVLSMHQGKPNPKREASIEICTHVVLSRDFFAAIHAIDASDLTIEPTVTLRCL